MVTHISPKFSRRRLLATGLAATGRPVASYEGDDSGRLEGEQLVLSPDSRRLAGPGEGFVIKVRELGAGTALAALKGHTDRRWDLQFNADGRYLASASADRTVRLPIHGRAESLNLAATAAVCLYASARAQRSSRRRQCPNG